MSGTNPVLKIMEAFRYYRFQRTLYWDIKRSKKLSSKDGIVYGSQVFLRRNKQGEVNATINTYSKNGDQWKETILSRFFRKKEVPVAILSQLTSDTDFEYFVENHKCKRREAE